RVYREGWHPSPFARYAAASARHGAATRDRRRVARGGIAQGAMGEALARKPAARSRAGLHAGIPRAAGPGDKGLTSLRQTRTRAISGESLKRCSAGTIEQVSNVEGFRGRSFRTARALATGCIGSDGP